MRTSQNKKVKTSNEVGKYFRSQKLASAIDVVPENKFEILCTRVEEKHSKWKRYILISVSIAA